MTPSDLTGPFPSSRDLTDYRDEPGYSIPPRNVPSGYDVASRTLARLGITERKAAA